MDLPDAIAALSQALRRRRPLTFDPAWIKSHQRDVYAFIASHVRTDLGDID